jgi:hypothetical protein
MMSPMEMIQVGVIASTMYVGLVWCFGTIRRRLGHGVLSAYGKPALVILTIVAAVTVGAR